jgi:hypothetical protein
MGAGDQVFAVPDDIRAVGQNSARVAKEMQMALKSLGADVEIPWSTICM